MSITTTNSGSHIAEFDKQDAGAIGAVLVRKENL